MATYAELTQASENGTLRGRIRVALVIAAETIRTEPESTPNHVNRLVWAKQVFTNLDSFLEQMLWAVLAQNKDATLVQITGALDPTVQTAVNAAVDVFATGA